jgi:predicted phage terminase large subunit-like protein
MAALQFADVPGYSALLLRRTFADLTKANALMNRARTWLAGTKAHWDQIAHRWTFPSGASLEFGYLDTENDRDNYRSAEFQFIGFDELTTFREVDYRFLFSRLRRLKDSFIPIRMRSGTNPGSIGHEWVKKRFITEITEGRRFIPAKIGDNEHIDAAEYIRSLAELDPITRAQMLAGDWNSYAGGRFQKEWLVKTFVCRSDGQWILDGRSFTPKDISIFQTVDHASTVKRTSKADPDWTVISTWGVTPAKHLLWIDCERFRGEIPEVRDRVRKSYNAARPMFVAIEGGGTQKALVQLARELGLVCKEYLPGQRDKLQRAARLIVLAESGKLYLADAASWREMAVGELLRFTGDEKRDEHDDIVDTAAMAAEMLDMVDQQRNAGGIPRVHQR